MPRPKPLDVSASNLEKFYDETNPLSAVFLVKVRYCGREYKSAEHAYQTHKIDPELAGNDYETIISEIMDAETGVAAKEAAYKYRQYFRIDWDKVKFTIMHEIIREKLYQNPEILEILLKTKRRYLYEDSPVDDKWGMVTQNGIAEGYNFSGRILIILRDHPERIFTLEQ